jgi:putative peptidoglycan lipid II flippase
MAGWVEFLLLRSRLNRRIGAIRIPARTTALLWLCALMAAGSAYGLKLVTIGLHRFLMAAVVLGAFGLVYVGLTYAFRVPEARLVLARVRRR